MKRKQVLRREDLAIKLEEWASRIRVGKSIAEAGSQMKIPERVEIETEFETEDGQTEFELEIKWPASSSPSAPLVGILTGSPNDLETVKGAYDVLRSFKIPCEMRALSAHRTPDLTIDYVKTSEERGIELIIACAGMAAHLAGVVAANCLLPIIGVPLASGRLDGLDSLLSTVQMPPGVPVATVAIDGAKNAGFLAARILALKYPEIRLRLEEAMALERSRYTETAAEKEKRFSPEKLQASESLPKKPIKKKVRS